ncbi:type II secretion system protein N [Rhodoferax sp.]|jgi:general secretion pathway protein C|uniref:type II secretion system protein N n=1 Tax=Rhodoferax sp. TaxID=50421 RepID=UPI0037848D97
MQRNVYSPWAPRLGAFFSALLLGASAVYWALQWQQAQPAAPASAAAQSELPTAALGAVVGVLGGRPQPVTNAPVQDRSEQFKLVGVLARSNGRGAAIISVNDLPPKAFRVGSTVTEEWVLHTVAPRQATLARGADRSQTHILDMPAADATN